MINKFTEGLRNMPPVQMLENGTLIILLVLSLVLFFNSSSTFNKYFIPIACILAVALRLTYWAQYGNEPQFLTPLVSVVSNLLS